MLAREIDKALGYLRFQDKLGSLEPTRAQISVHFLALLPNCCVISDKTLATSKLSFPHLNLTMKDPLITAFVISPGRQSINMNVFPWDQPGQPESHLTRWSFCCGGKQPEDWPPVSLRASSGGASLRPLSGPCWSGFRFPPSASEPSCSGRNQCILSLSQVPNRRAG